MITWLCIPSLAKILRRQLDFPDIYRHLTCACIILAGSTGFISNDSLKINTHTRIQLLQSPFGGHFQFLQHNPAIRTVRLDHSHQGAHVQLTVRLQNAQHVRDAPDVRSKILSSRQPGNSFDGVQLIGVQIVAFDEEDELNGLLEQGHVSSGEVVVDRTCFQMGLVGRRVVYVVVDGGDRYGGDRE